MAEQSQLRHQGRDNGALARHAAGMDDTATADTTPATATAHPLQFLIEEADRLRAIAESDEVETLRANGEKLTAVAKSKREATTNITELPELHEGAALLSRACTVDTERVEARKRLAEIEGLLRAGQDEKTALAALEAAQFGHRATLAHRDRLGAVLTEIEAELAELSEERERALSEASASAVRARMERTPRPPMPPDRTSERRAILSAEAVEAGHELEKAEEAARSAEVTLRAARDTWIEARYRVAMARYVWALAAFVPYCAEAAAAARLIDFPAPEFSWKPDGDEIAAATASIEAEIGA